MTPPSTLTHVTPQGPRTLAELQNLSKRDPESYRSDFLQQWRHYESNLQIFLLKPTDDAKVSEHVVVEDVVVEAVECEEEREVRAGGVHKDSISDVPYSGLHSAQSLVAMKFTGRVRWVERMSAKAAV
jgi:hypothetical protein